MSVQFRDDVDLLTAMNEPHDAAMRALTDPRYGAPAAIAWCSAHLVAADCVLYPAARRHVPDGRLRVQHARAVDRQLQHALFRLDRRLTGDSHRGEVLSSLADDVWEKLWAHTGAEHGLVEDLMVALSPSQQQDLTNRLASAMASAPTRPHPYTRHTPLSGLVARIDACVDRIRDTMDNRVVPCGRPARAPRALSLWGCYVTGAPYGPAQQQEPPPLHGPTTGRTR